MSEIKIRPLKLEDIPQVLEIEAKIRVPDSPQPTYDIDLENTAKSVIPQNFSFGAEIDGKLVGFVMGHVRSSEFGEKGKIGWLNVIGVDPEYQGQKIGTLLGEELIKSMKKAGVIKIQTMVHWKMSDLINYFSSLGFDKSPMVVVEKQLLD